MENFTDPSQFYKKYLEKLEKDKKSGKESESFFKDRSFFLFLEKISLQEDNFIENNSLEFDYELNNSEFYQENWSTKKIEKR